MGKTRRRVSPRLAKISVSERRFYVKYAKKLMLSWIGDQQVRKYQSSRQLVFNLSHALLGAEFRPASPKLLLEANHDAGVHLADSAFA